MGADTVIVDAVLSGPGGAPPVPDGAVVLAGDRIAWSGPRAELPAEHAGAEPWSAGGRLVTPGLVECHTHLLFGGDRRDEWAARAAGTASYVDQLTGADTGVRATAAATAARTDDELLAAARRRAHWMIDQGVTTLEVKTGYGLDPESELRLLGIAARLRDELPTRTRITLLVGHVYPAGVDRDDYEATIEYVTLLSEQLLPVARDGKMMDAVEVYLDDEGGMTLDDASTLLEVAYKTKIPTRLQTDQLSDSAGAALAPAFYSKAAAHVNFADEVAIGAMANSGTTVVLLPAAHLEIGVEQKPPVQLMREKGIRLAVATGCNPGTAPVADLRTAAHLACVLFGLTPAEAFAGITVRAAGALGLADDGTGTLAAGAPADLAVWDAEHPDELLYWMGAPLCRAVWAAGREIERT